jgi:hypothetical protein
VIRCDQLGQSIDRATTQCCNVTFGHARCVHPTGVILGLVPRTQLSACVLWQPGPWSLRKHSSVDTNPGRTLGPRDKPEDDLLRALGRFVDPSRWWFCLLTSPTPSSRFPGRRRAQQRRYPGPFLLKVGRDRTPSAEIILSHVAGLSTPDRWSPRAVSSSSARIRSVSVCFLDIWHLCSSHKAQTQVVVHRLRRVRDKI